MRIALLFFCFLTGCIPALAQNQDSVAIRKYYEQNTIYWTGATKYYKNNQSYPLKNLREEVKFSADAVHELALYRRSRAYLNITMISSFGFLVSGIAVHDRQTKLLLLTGCIITASISIPISVTTGKHLGRAIWFHNRDVLLK